MQVEEGTEISHIHVQFSVMRCDASEFTRMTDECAFFFQPFQIMLPPASRSCGRRRVHAPGMPGMPGMFELTTFKTNLIPL